MKKCPTCGIEKDEFEFGKSSLSKDGLFYQCKDCKRKYDRKIYEQNRERILEYKRKQYQSNREHYRNYQREYDKIRKERFFKLKQPCAKCGESRLYLIDYHHIDPKTKLHNINKIKHCKTVKDEVKKCVCLCRNCHTEYHYVYGNVPENPIETLTEYLGVNPYSLIPQF